jgi:hypothetical protein
VNGPFTSIAPYYSDKRDRDVKAMNFCFRKFIHRFCRRWRWMVAEYERYRENTRKIGLCMCIHVFRQWVEIFKSHFKGRQHEELRRGAAIYKTRFAGAVASEVKHVRTDLLQQLRRDRRIMEMKLAQFDRLSEVHSNAIVSRQRARDEVKALAANYFSRQEELQLIDVARVADTIASKVRAVRLNLAQAWVFHINRVIISHQNQLAGQCKARCFRLLADPVLEHAVSYFAEKRQITKLCKTWKNQQRVLCAIVSCSGLYHKFFGWTSLQKFVGMAWCNRTPGLIELIRRKRELLLLFPYFDWLDVLPVRAPRPLREVAQVFRDLPGPSIQKKLARERVHHLNVRAVLKTRRLMRDYFRAYASCVQERIATRAIKVLMAKRVRLRYLRHAYTAFRMAADKGPLPPRRMGHEDQVYKDLGAWFRHFVRFQHRQRQVAHRTRHGHPPKS